METYTAEEILEIVHELDLPGEITIDDDQDTLIVIESEDFKWQIALGGDGPFHGSIRMFAVQTDPKFNHSHSNNWNQDHGSSTMLYLTNEESNDFSLTEENEFIVVLKSFLPFFGSMSKEAISFAVYCFHDDVCEFYGIQTEDETSDVHAPNETPDGEPIPLIEQIQLELALNAPQSARGIAKSLNTSKYEVNSTLYRHIDMFQKEGTSPPFWSNKP